MLWKSRLWFLESRLWFLEGGGLHGEKLMYQENKNNTIVVSKRVKENYTLLLDYTTVAIRGRSIQNSCSRVGKI
jgi:hypothetical protein